MPWSVAIVGAASVTSYSRSKNPRRSSLLAGVFGVLMGVLVLLIIWPILKGGQSGAERAARPLTHAMPESPLRQAPLLTIAKPTEGQPMPQAGL